MATTEGGQMAKPNQTQHAALADLINGVTGGHPIVHRTWRVMERQGWIKDGQVTEAGRQAYLNDMAHPDV